MHPKDKVTEEENSKTRGKEIKLSAPRSGSLIGDKTVNLMLWV